MKLRGHLVPKSLSCAERLLPGLDGGLDRIVWMKILFRQYRFFYLDVERVDIAEMSPKRKFALDGFCCWPLFILSTFPCWLCRESPRAGSRLPPSFGSYGLQKTYLHIVGHGKKLALEIQKRSTHESERKLCICVKLPRGSGGGGSSSSTESTWTSVLSSHDKVCISMIC